MIGGIVNKTREDEREERKRERGEERKREKGERERERERMEERERRERGPPCVRSKRLRVYVQYVPVCTGSMPTCIKHVGMLLVHTGTF